MEELVNNLKDNVEKLDEVSSRTDLALTEMRLQFETMMEMQKEERIETQKMHNEEKDKMRKHYGRIIIGLILTLFLILGSIIGGTIYLVTNFEFATIEYGQDIQIGGDGNPTINDGIHYNRTN